MMGVGGEMALDPSALGSPPRDVSRALASATERALQHLPDELLRAMVSGLRMHADDLAPGVLFRGKSSGGCAVGITLRELAPDAFDFGWLQFWLRQRWRRGIERDVARRYPRLNHLQRYFDEAVAEIKETGRDPHPARTVGLWFASSADAELAGRRRDTTDARPVPTPPPHRADGPLRELEHEADRELVPAGPEVRG